MTSSATVDPVCGMRVSVDEGITLLHGGVELVFCSEACRREFLRNPRAYTDIPGTAVHEGSRSGQRKTRAT